MSEEIKKILDYLKPKYDVVDELGNDYKKVKFKDCKLLLDYITSLQQKVKQLENIRKEAIEYINRKKYQPSPLGFELELNPKELFQLQNILNKGSDKDV